MNHRYNSFTYMGQDLGAGPLSFRSTRDKESPGCPILVISQSVPISTWSQQIQCVLHGTVYVYIY
jgi:hypothetical protein